MKLAFAAATDGSEVKDVHVIGNSFRAISAKLSPAYGPRLLYLTHCPFDFLTFVPCGECRMVQKLRTHPAVSIIEEHQIAHVNEEEKCHLQKDVIWVRPPHHL
jgi:hypothetical protein